MDSTAGGVWAPLGEPLKTCSGLDAISTACLAICECLSLFVVSGSLLSFFFLFDAALFFDRAWHCHCAVWSRAVEAFFGWGVAITVIASALWADCYFFVGAVFCFVMFILITWKALEEVDDFFSLYWLSDIIVLKHLRPPCRALSAMLIDAHSILNTCVITEFNYFSDF